MTLEEVNELVKTLNERFVKEQKETLEKVTEMLKAKQSPECEKTTPDGRNQEVMELIDYRVNQRIAQVKAELREEVAHFNQQTASANNDWDSFRKQSEYIQLLVQVQGADHNVHKELDEAIAKIKELTYT